MTQPTKSELRKQYRDLRNNIASASHAEKSAKIRERICDFILANSLSSVAIYYPINNEVDLLGLLPWAKERGVKVYAPKTFSDWSMQFLPVGSDEDFVASGQWQVPEPVVAIAAPEDTDLPELIIVPALAFDHLGYRLGYGQGYYDTFLYNYPGLTIGALFSEFMHPEALPKDEWDMPVQYLLTEAELWKV
jgi:5-formyltetrahydrofolate cyclo-ligase